MTYRALTCCVRFDPVMVEDLHVVFDPVCQLNRQPFRRVEDYLNVVRTILIMRANSQPGLLLDCLRELVFGSSHESRIEQLWRFCSSALSNFARTADNRESLLSWSALAEAADLADSGSTRTVA
jgi:hypothetical protein